MLLRSTRLLSIYLKHKGLSTLKQFLFLSFAVVDTATCDVHCDVMGSYGNPRVCVRPELMHQTQIILHEVK